MRLLLVFLFTCVLHAQTVEPRPAFEVVSIKPQDPANRPGPPSRDPGRVSYPTATLKFLIMRAYNVKNYQINGPSWLEEMHFYSFSAKIPDGASQEQIPAMLQTMLAERFGLKVHWEKQRQPVYALVVGKNGPKLKKSDLTVEPSLSGPNGTRVPGSMSFSTFGRFEYSHATMDKFAESMSVNLGRPVLNMTDLDGQFDIILNLNPPDIEMLKNFRMEDGSISDNPNSGSVFTKLQALGLKLESRKAPIDHIIVDSAFRVPTEN